MRNNSSFINKNYIEFLPQTDVSLKYSFSSSPVSWKKHYYFSIPLNIWVPAIAYKELSKIKIKNVSNSNLKDLYLK